MADPTLDEIRVFYNEKTQNLIDTINNDRQKQIIVFVNKNKDILSGKDVLSIGCGVGSIEGEMAKICNITGIDISDDMIRYAKEHFQGKYICAAFEDYDFGDRRFDTICYFDAIEHFRSSVLLYVIAKTDKLLKPGGHILFNIPQESVSIDWHNRRPEWLQIVDNPINIGGLVNLFNQHSKYIKSYEEKMSLFVLLRLDKVGDNK